MINLATKVTGILNFLKNSKVGKNIKYAIAMAVCILSILPALDVGLYLLLKPTGFWQELVFFLLTFYFLILELSLFCLMMAFILTVSKKVIYNHKRGK